MNSIVEELKDKIDIVELISQYVQLKKRGSNYFGLCPFHSEKTPSFSVNPGGRFFHCFGCGASGDAITFFMKIENLEFRDAIKELAERYGVTLQNVKEEKNPILEIHRYAAEYFHAKLLNNPQALAYLEKRGLDKKTIDDFNLGYAPQSNELYANLKKMHKEQDLIRSGIFIKTTNGLYNRFSNRIIFPIKNENGLTIAFGGRIMDSDKSKAKYINSPETELFSKQKIFYGLYEAKDTIRKEKYAIITEGYMDCIRLHSSNIKNAVATLGTALSRYHTATVKRYAERLFFNYDADEAGFNAMARSAKIVLSSDLFSYVIKLDKNYDPDSFILKYGKEMYLERVKNAEDYFTYIINHLKQRFDISKPQNRLKAAEEIKPILLGIKNGIMRSAYISKASSELNISENIFFQKNNIRNFFSNISKEEAFLSYLLKDIELLAWIDDPKNFGEHLSGLYKELYYKLENFYMSGEKFSMGNLEKTLNSEELKKLAYTLASIEYTDMDSRHEQRKAFLCLVNQFKKESIKNRLKTIKKQLSENPTEGLLEEYNKLFLELKETVE